jgi:hypothetical protein
MLLRLSANRERDSATRTWDETFVRQSVLDGSIVMDRSAGFNEITPPSGITHTT